MSYDFNPRDKSVENFSINEFGYEWLIDHGMGAILDCGNLPDDLCHWCSELAINAGRSPLNNEGYYVTAEEARAISLWARGTANHCEITEDHRALTEENPVFGISRLRRLAEFCERSRGFWIW